MSCDGCGASRFEFAHVRLGPGMTLFLCKARDGFEASTRCLLAALKKIPPTCPGCGVRHPNAYIGQLCAECVDAIALGKLERTRLKGTSEAEPCFVSVDAALFGAPSLGLPSERDETIRDALAVLVRGEIVRPNVEKVSYKQRVGGTTDDASGYRGHGYVCYLAPLTPEQVAATRSLLERIRADLIAMHAMGFNRGSSVLARLATGDMSVVDFEGTVKRETREG